MNIPVLKPSITDEEINAVAEVLRSGWLGLGPKTAEFEREFALKVGAKYCAGLNSCTAALHLATALLNLQPGDEILVTPMTFVSTVHAITYHGATPVFVDILPDTLNMDPEDAARKITDKTKAVLAVDMAGHPCDWDELLELAEIHGLTPIEDAAHSCGATYKGRTVGSVVPLTCFSFHAVKNLTCGEGGAITCDDEWQDKWFKEMRWLGITKGTWSRNDGATGYRWKYWVEHIGFKCHMNDIAAAIGLVQLRRLDRMNAARRQVAANYTAAFAEIDWLAVPVEKRDVRSSWHLYQVRLPDEKRRDRFIDYLAEKGISTGVHYFPIHLQPCYRDLKSVCPTAGKVWKTLVTLPVYADLSEDDQNRIIEAVRSFRP